jgi:hypothetical protein
VGKDRRAANSIARDGQAPELRESRRRNGRLGSIIRARSPSPCISRLCTRPLTAASARGDDSGFALVLIAPAGFGRVALAEASNSLPGGVERCAPATDQQPSARDLSTASRMSRRTHQIGRVF